MMLYAFVIICLGSTQLVIAINFFLGHRSAVEIFAAVATGLTEKIAEILAVNLGADVTYFRENCTKGSCYLRLNRYPPCPFSSEVFGLVPHTDSDFLTIVCQDRVGGLQLMKGDGSWVNVSPNPDALVINIGDLLQVTLNLIDQIRNQFDFTYKCT